MKKTLLAVAVAISGTAIATPFNGNDAQSNAMGNTGVASSEVQNAVNFNPALLADQYDGVGFGMTLPSIKFYIDDSKGLIKSGEDFATGGAWEDIQNIDADALSTAIAGDGGSIPSMSDVLTDIVSNITDITTAINNIKASTDAQQKPNDTDITNLNTASGLLSSNATILDDKTTVADTQSNNISTSVDSTLNGLQSMNSAPLQLGLGIDILNAALPSETMGLAIGISSNTTVGTNINISQDDFEPVENLASDLTAMSARASAMTASMTVLADANSALTAHINNQPDHTDTSKYPAGQLDPQYQTDIQAWGNRLELLSNDVATAQTDLDTKLNALTGYNGNYVSGGELNPPTVGELTSEVEFVGANITEVSISAARRFIVGGEDIAFGVTPKIQSINIFEKTIGLANAEDEMDLMSADPNGYFLNNTTSLMRVNVDFGAAKTWDFHGKVRAGIALKDLIPWTLESKSGTELLIRPKLRVGAAHETKFTKVAVDLDITENKPLKYGVPTRYFGLGAELNAWNWAALRAGYRANLSVEDSSVISGGIGITPFGVGLEVSAWAKPASFDDWATVIQDAGMVVEFSMNF